MPPYMIMQIDQVERCNLDVTVNLYEVTHLDVLGV